MTQKTKKLINAPEDIIPEMIEGMLAAWPDLLALEGETGRAIVAQDGPRDGKVGIVIGGGSGHEPAFAGYVGRELADAEALGNIFASPSPAQILDACHAADGGAGGSARHRRGFLRLQMRWCRRRPGRTVRSCRGSRPSCQCHVPLDGRGAWGLFPAPDRKAEFRDRPRGDGAWHGHPWRAGHPAQYACLRR